METLVEHQPYHTLLQEAFNDRKEKNPAFSLRAFSRVLGISVTTLSQVMRYERNLSPRNLEKLTSYLGLSPREVEKLTPHSLKRESDAIREEQKQILEDEFHLISDWYYFAILNLAVTGRCLADSHWVAKHFGISPLEANTALSRLKRMGLIEKKGRILKRKVGPLKTTQEIPNSAVRHLHKQQLKLASAALEKVSLAQRDISSDTMAIDPSRLPLAKQKIREFRKLLMDLLEGGEKKEVYLLSMQLFPLKNWENL